MGLSFWILVQEVTVLKVGGDIDYPEILGFSLFAQ